MWHVVYVPRHPSAVYGTKLAGEIESNVIPTKVYVGECRVCVMCVSVCDLKESVNATEKERIGRMLNIKDPYRFTPFRTVIY